MIVASTTWNIERRGTLFAAAEELMAIGFEGVELRAPLGAPDAATCGDRLRRARVRVASAHAPLLAGREDSLALGGLASLDDRDRARAVEGLIASGRAALAAGTTKVVVHAGSVPVADAADRLRRWREIHDREGSVTPRILEEAASLLAERATLRTGALQAAIRSLHAACRALPDAVFAVECPLHLHEIPALDEVELLFSEVGARNLMYAHDTGHAAVQHALGGPSPEAWLARYGDRCVVAHLHDVAGLEDHLPPGAGVLPWKVIAGSLPSKCVRTLEVNARWPREMLLEGLRCLSR